MILSEIHQINKSNPNWSACDALSWHSKNLYNQALRLFNDEYKETGHFIRFKDMDILMKNQPDEYNNYKLLTASVSQQVLMLFDKNVKSFLSLINLWKKDKTKLTGCPKFMKYKDKDNGRNIVIIRGDKFVAKVKDGFIHFPKKLNLQPIKSKYVKTQEDLIQIRIIPKSSHYNLEIIYNKPEDVNDFTGKAAIDLGINNLATLTTDTGITELYSGKEIKSINKYYNKLKADKQSKLIKYQQRYRSKGLTKLTAKRNNKINDKLHKISKQIVKSLKANKIKEVAIGYNKEWKQGVNLGKRLNQTFVSIPYYRFIEMLTYKCKLTGINVLLHEEAYTSKCSSLDLELIKKHEIYLGTRVKRGLFKTSKGLKINADVNGSLNIGRKVFGDAYMNNIIKPTNIGLPVKSGLVNQAVLNPLKYNKF
jgi:putative transposase